MAHFGTFEVVRLPVGDGCIDCLWAPVADRTHTLTAREAASVTGAVTVRKHTYSTGRWLAHRALGRLDMDVSSILSGAAREPLWPSGATGSITHTDRLAAAAVASREVYSAIGIDMEKVGKVENRLLPKLLTGNEIAALHSLDPTLVFSAKESCYKLLYPLFGQYVDFREVEIVVNESDSSFNMRYVGNNPALGVVERATGSFKQLEDHWLTAAALFEPAV